jgi:Zn-dependent protease
VIQSLRIGKIRGITVRLHWSWLVAAGLFALADHPLLVYLVALLPIVLLHELGHGIAAQRFGLHVVDITIWPLGGFARMSRIPEDARVEGFVALAGPGVNLALAALAAPFALLDGGAGVVARILCLVNLILGATNLLPAFPLDGGRVLRAFLARRGDWVRATERAVAAGRFVALGLAIYGLATLNLLLLVFAAVFWLAGAQELLTVRLRHGLSPLGGRPLWNPFGQGPRDARPEPPGDAPTRPSSPGSDPAAPSRGFSARDIERLERFPGPLRHLRDEP